MRVARPVVLSAEQRDMLESRARARSVERPRIVLLAIDLRLAWRQGDGWSGQGVRKSVRRLSVIERAPFLTAVRITLVKAAQASAPR